MVRVCLALLIFFLPSIIVADSQIDSTEILFHFHGPTNDAKIGSYLRTLGDINSDGYDDIAISSQIPFGSHIFLGGNPIDSIPDMFINGNITSIPIDLDGDGINDVISCLIQGDSFGATYFYKGYGDSLASLPYDSLYPVNDNFAFGWIVRSGYVDSDSLGDIITIKANTPGGPTLYYYSGCPAIDTIPDWTFKITGYTHTFSGFGFIDFNGDEHLDLFVGFYADLDTISSVRVFFGPTFANQPDMLIFPPAGHDSLDIETFATELANIGDADGDGWDDLGVIYNRHFLIYRCGSIADTLFDYWMQAPSHELSRAGDINGDGYNDLLSGDGRTFDGAVDVYLGGAEFDIFYDFSIYRANLPPLFLESIGFELSPAGDFNGDGYDDFMFSCKNFNLSAPWDVFMMKGGPFFTTEVEDPGGSELPQKLKLNQNYPNPFNPNTVIEFELPRTDHVTLTIFNLLGQQVKQLFKGELSSGVHRVFWDGRDNDKRQLSSGIYFYTLKTSKETSSKKMLLLK